MRHAAIRATDSFDRLATLANLSTVTLATLRPVQPVCECYSVASLTVCESRMLNQGGGLSPLVLVVHAGAFGTRRARPIRFVAAHEWKVKESVGADLRAARVAGGRGRPPL